MPASNMFQMNDVTITDQQTDDFLVANSGSSWGNKHKDEVQTVLETITDAERDKLASIESSATGDLSAAEVKTLYESNTNTNAFTDADETKLDNLPTSFGNDYILIQHIIDDDLAEPEVQVSTAWSPRPLDTIQVDTGNNVTSLSGGNFRLKAGTYEIDYHGYVGAGQAGGIGLVGTRLWNVSDSVEIRRGLINRVSQDSADKGSATLHLSDRFVLVVDKTLAIQHKKNSISKIVMALKDDTGGSPPLGSGEPKTVYAELVLRKVG